MTRMRHLFYYQSLIWVWGSKCSPKGGNRSQSGAPRSPSVCARTRHLNTQTGVCPKTAQQDIKDLVCRYVQWEANEWKLRYQTSVQNSVDSVLVVLVFLEAFFLFNSGHNHRSSLKSLFNSPLITGHSLGFQRSGLVPCVVCRRPASRGKAIQRLTKPSPPLIT